MVTQADIIAQLDRLKYADRGYLVPDSYKAFIPVGLPRTTELPDSSLIRQRLSASTNISDSANELSAVQAQNARDYAQMVRAQQALEQARGNLKRAQRLQALSASYNGPKKATRINVAGKGNKNSAGTDMTGGGSINVPGGKFKDQTPFQPDAGLGTYNWNGFKLTVNRSMADNFIGFLNALSKTGYKVTSLGSYANRNIAGTNTKSLHAYGLAIDINPSANPVAYDKVITNLPPGVGRLAAKYGLAWGGKWNGSKKDPMHFSKPWNGTM